MTQNVNDILSRIQSLGYKIMPSTKLKKDGSKPIDASKFYNENTNIFKDVSLLQFESFVKEKANGLKRESIVSPGSISNVLQQCGFIYEKFRWFVTSEMTKVYYVKTRVDAEEYKLLTTDRDSFKFFNSLTDDDLLKLTELCIYHNSIEQNKDNFINEEKIVKLVMEDLRKNPAYRLQEEPITLSNNPTTPCFKFYNIKAVKDKGDEYLRINGKRPPTPAWDQFFARIRDQNMVPLVKAFFTGIFVAKNKAKQCLYIWGAGNDGKSQITEALTQAMGETVTFVMDQYMRSNQFSSYDAFGKRLAIGEEMSAPNIIKNKTFHAITGQSRVRIEAKGEQAFHARLYACAIVTSNEKPLIEDVKNQTTRLLYIEVDSATEEEINKSGISWGKALQTEFENMIYEGIKYYKIYNPDGGSYRMMENYENTLSDLHDDETIRMDEFIDKFFEYCPGSKIRNRLGDGFLQYVTVNYFNEKIVPPSYRDNQMARKIYEKLKLKFPNITHGRPRIGGIQIRIIYDLKISNGGQGLLPIFEVENDQI